MHKILIFTLILISVLGLKSRNGQHLKNSHLFNEQLCKNKGGIVCGFVQKDCCQKSCESKYLGLNQVCSQGKVIDLNLSSCQNICATKGGVAYTDKVLSQPKCCKTGALSGDKCSQTSQIQLGQCQSQTLTDKIVGLVNK